MKRECPSLFAALLVSLLVTCLLFYAPMSIGYSFANHKGLLSVVFYFVIQAVQQIFGVCTLAGLADDSSLLNHLLQNVFSGGRMVRCCHSYVYPAAGPSVFLFMQDTQNHFCFLP